MSFLRIKVGLLLLSLCCLPLASHSLPLQCSRVFRKPIELPRELNLPREDIEAITDSWRLEQLSRLETALRALNSEGILVTVGFALRVWSWRDLPLEPLEGQSPHYSLEYFRSSLSTEVGVVVKDVERLAVIANLNGAISTYMKSTKREGLLSNSDIWILSYLLSGKISKSHFLGQQIVRRVDLRNWELESENVTRIQNIIDRVATHILRNSVMRVVITDLFTNPKIVEFFEPLFEDNMNLKAGVARLKNPRFVFKNTSTHKSVLKNLLIRLVYEVVRPKVVSEGGHQQQELINALQTFFMTEIGGWSQGARDLLILIDHYFFDIPLPLDKGTVRSYLLEGANSFILPLKSDLREERLGRKKVVETIQPATNRASPDYGLVIRSRGWAPDRTGVAQPWRTSNQIQERQSPAAGVEAARSRGEEPRALRPQLEDVILGNAAIESGKVYHFRFLREMQNQSEQRVVFREEVLEDIRSKNGQPEAYLKALRMGFLGGRDRGKGLKIFGRTFGMDNVFELRADNGSFRVLVTRIDGVWLAYKFVHKDDLARGHFDPPTEL